MIEAFFVVFVIFVAYVIYIIVIEPNKAAARAAALKPTSKPKAAKPTRAAKPAAKVTEKPAKKAPVKTSSPAKASAETAQAASVLRNPKTGDTANVPNNYRFAKRWLKEALVEEGLLDKIYKTNELDDSANNKIKEAIKKLATIKKYHG